MILILFLRISCRDAQLGRLNNKIIMSLWGQWRHPDGNNRDAQIVIVETPKLGVSITK